MDVLHSRDYKMLTKSCRRTNVDRAEQIHETLAERRRALRELPGLRFVHREEFCDLLLSFKKLVRSDEPAVRIRGLMDVESGERYLIEHEELFASVS
jgi:hypothetical protein